MGLNYLQHSCYCNTKETYLEHDFGNGHFWGYCMKCDGLILSYVEERKVETPTPVDSTNPKDKLGVKKPRLSLVPPAGVLYASLAMANGADKYGPYNWRSKKVQAMIYLEACKRHIDEFQDGADIDKEPTCVGCQEREAGTAEKCRFGHSWLPHLGHAIACLAILVDAIETGNVVDDRPLPGAMSRLIEKWTKK